MEDSEVKRLRDNQIKSLLEHAIDEADFPPSLDSVVVGRENANEIAKEYGRVCRQAVDDVMNAFLDLLIKNREKLKFENDEQMIGAGLLAASDLFQKARTHIDGVIMLRGWDAYFHPANEALRHMAYAVLEHRRSKLEDRIKRRIEHRDILDPQAGATTNITLRDSTVGVVNTGQTDNINVSINAKKEAPEGGL